MDYNGNEPACPTIFHVTHWKAGSQWVYKILKDCVPDLIVPPEGNEALFLHEKLESGKVYPTVYITKEVFDNADLPENWRRFIVFRDLRDTLISGYFSMKFSHPVIDQSVMYRRHKLFELSLEDGLIFLLDEFLNSSAQIQKSWLDAGVPFLRYEDLIANDLEIFVPVLLDECQLPVSRERLEEVIIASRFGKLSGGRAPGQADITAHVRKGIAGDWKNYFTPRVVKEFNAKYGDLVDRAGYEICEDYGIITPGFSARKRESIKPDGEIQYSNTFSEDGNNLVFLISLPRSGSTLLQRILGSHEKIHTVSEPWIMLHPIYGLKKGGIKAEYEASLARDSLEDFLAQIPEGDELYIEAIRAMAMVLYRRVLETSGKSIFLDKTPRYYLIIPELKRVFPKAKFIILNRHPLAVLSSILENWCDNQPEKLKNTPLHTDISKGPHLLFEGIQDVIEDAIIVSYEKLVENPEPEVEQICNQLNIPFTSEMIDYGLFPKLEGRHGDPVKVNLHQKPVLDYVDKWKENISKSQELLDFASEYLGSLTPSLVAQMGYSYAEIEQQLKECAKGLSILPQKVLNEFRQAVIFGDGCHIDEGEFRWLADEAHITVQSAFLYRPIELNFQLQCITSNAYSKFPFETKVIVNQKTVRHLIFNTENQQENVKLLLPASKTDIEITLVSSACFIPSEHGHEDTRRLAVQFSKVLVYPGESSAEEVIDQISLPPVDELEAAYLKLRDPKSKIFPSSNTNELIQRLNDLDFNVEEFVIDVDDYHQYFQAARYSEDFPDYYSFNIKEKSLEHYIAARLLKLQNQDIYIDIASQESPVPKIYNKLFGVTSYRQDLKYPPGINDFTIGGDAANMPIPNEFTNKLALHCSFEHFEGDSDIRFIHEIERVLKPGGAACIVPLYLSSQYFIMTNPLIAIGQNVPFEEGALVVSNPELNSRHGRFYDPESLCTRVRQHMGNLKIRIINIKNSKEVDSSCYVRFAMVLEKGGDNDKATTEEVFIKKADEKVTVEEIPAQRNEPVKQMPLEEWISLVEQLVAQGEIELGIYRLFDGLDQYPQEVELYQLMALLMVQTGAYRSAESMLQKALIIDPKSADLYNQLGSIFYLQGSYLQSKQAYQKALELNPNLEDAVNNLHELDALLTKPN